MESRGPSQSLRSLPARVKISIFERGSASSSDDQDSPNADLARAETWSFENDSENRQSESPTSIHPEVPSELEDDWGEKPFFSDSDITPHSSVIVTRRSSHSDTTEMGDSISGSKDLERVRTSSFLLQGIFKGHQKLGKSYKDLGEFKPLAVPPVLSTNIHAESSRNSSSRASPTGDTTRPVSAGSEAEAALAAVKRSSPMSSPKPTPPPLLHVNGSGSGKDEAMARLPSVQDSRTRSNSAKYWNSFFPKFAKSIDLMTTLPSSLPKSQGIYSEHPPSISPPSAEDRLVTGYTSTPMSRDPSRELDTVAETGEPPLTSGLSSSLPSLQNISLANSVRSTLQNIPARLLEFGRFGERAMITPTSPNMPSTDGFSSIHGQNRVQFGQMEPVTISDPRNRLTSQLRPLTDRSSSFDADPSTNL